MIIIYIQLILHVLADGLTSLTAIIALVVGMYWKIYWLDCLSGIISSFVITKWAIDLMKGSGRDLIDFNKKNIVFTIKKYFFKKYFFIVK